MEFDSKSCRDAYLIMSDRYNSSLGLTLARGPWSLVTISTLMRVLKPSLLSTLLIHTYVYIKTKRGKLRKDNSGNIHLDFSESPAVIFKSCITL